MKKFEAVVIKLAPQSETQGGLTGSQDDECFWSHNLIDVGDDQHVSFKGGLRACQAREDLGEQGIPLQALKVPR